MMKSYLSKTWTMAITTPHIIPTGYDLQQHHRIQTITNAISYRTA